MNEQVPTVENHNYYIPPPTHSLKLTLLTRPILSPEWNRPSSTGIIWTRAVSGTNSSKGSTPPNGLISTLVTPKSTMIPGSAALVCFYRKFTLPSLLSCDLFFYVII